VLLNNLIIKGREKSLDNIQRDRENQIEVRYSPIHGKGLFAASDIAEGELVMLIRGEVISGDECERREEEEGNVYIFWNGDDTYIDTANTDKIKYINHNCDPNCEVEEGDDDSLPLFAIKDIKTGDEITMDYGYEDIYEDCSCNQCDNKKFISVLE
jgi:uncharacterized protein